MKIRSAVLISLVSALIAGECRADSSVPAREFVSHYFAQALADDAVEAFVVTPVPRGQRRSDDVLRRMLRNRSRAEVTKTQKIFNSVNSSTLKIVSTFGFVKGSPKRGAMLLAGSGFSLSVVEHEHAGEGAGAVLATRPRLIAGQHYLLFARPILSVADLGGAKGALRPFQNLFSRLRELKGKMYEARQGSGPFAIGEGIDPFSAIAVSPALVDELPRLRKFVRDTEFKEKGTGKELLGKYSLSTVDAAQIAADFGASVSGTTAAVLLADRTVKASKQRRPAPSAMARTPTRVGGRPDISVDWDCPND